MQRPKLPAKVPFKKALWALAKGVLVSLIIVLAVSGLFIAVWGWARFKYDFWPLDRSPVGPNLVASLVVTTLVVAHNEGRIVQKDELRNGNFHTMLSELHQQLLHPIEAFQEGTADAVVDELEKRESPGASATTNAEPPEPSPPRP